MIGIAASVGLGGENRRQDVLTIQSALKAAGLNPGHLDGRCGRLTIFAIEQFQKSFLRHPDGRIDRNGPTIKRLLGKSAAPHPPVLPGKKQPPRQFTGSVPPLPSPHNKAVKTPSPYAQTTTEFWQQRTPLPALSINAGLTCPSSAQMMALLGDPHGTRTMSHIVTESVGPFRATGLKPALDSLRGVLTRVSQENPGLFSALRSAGMHVNRKARGSNSYSNHAWGIAIDLKIGETLAPFRSPYSLRGLDALAPHFHKAGWYWGGGYHNIHRKDPMHFECSLALVRSFNL